MPSYPFPSHSTEEFWQAAGLAGGFAALAVFAVWAMRRQPRDRIDLAFVWVLGTMAAGLAINAGRRASIYAPEWGVAMAMGCLFVAWGASLRAVQKAVSKENAGSLRRGVGLLLGYMTLVLLPAAMGLSLRHPESHRMQSCRDRRHPLHLAFLSSLHETGAYPPAVTKRNGSAVSWRETVSSELGFDGDPPAWTVCPTTAARRGESAAGRTAWCLLVGEGTAYPNGVDCVRRTDMLSGTSKQLLVVEASGRRIGWREPKDVDAVALPPGVNLPGSRPGYSDGWLSADHPRSANGLMADGSVRRFGNETDAEVLRRLANPSRKESADF